MDLSTTTAPRSDQQNFDDYAAGPKTVTISKVTKGSAEQPVDIHLEEFPGRPFKPSKSMRRVLVAAWGPDSSTYAGRRMVLYGDPSIRFGGEPVGGIRIRSLSHIDKPVSVPLTVTRGKRTPFTVQPLKEEQPPPPADTSEPTAEEVAAATDIDALKAMWRVSSPDRRKQIEARVQALTAGATDDEPELFGGEGA